VELTKSFKNIKKDVSELIILFGEDESCQPSDFFEMFYTFAREFSTCNENIM